MIRTNHLFLIATLTALGATGCAMPKMPTWDDWSITRYEDRLKETKYQQPTRMVVLWSPAIQNGLNVDKAQRGFGGRIYFYNAADQAIPVEGQLIVYGYNDTTPNQRHVKPDKKFVFTPQQFTAHYSPTELGASYSVWVGWDDVGGAQAEVSLVPIFTSSSGHIVVGQTSRNVLPGPTTPAPTTRMQTTTMTSQVHDERIPQAGLPQPTSYVPASPTTHGLVEQASYQPQGMYPPQQPAAAPYGVQQASMQQTIPGSPQALAHPGLPMPPAQPQEPQMETMSITLPTTLARRLAAAGTQPARPVQPVGQPAYRAPGGMQQPAGSPAGGAMHGQPLQGQPVLPQNQSGVQQPTFTAPTNVSRSWGPVRPRRGALPLGPQSRYEPESLQAPASPSPQSFGGPPPMQPPHGAPGPAHPQTLQSGLPIAAPAAAPAAPGTRL